MKRIDFGQVFQVLANIGVLVGIAVLVVEIRQNTVATQVMAAQNMISSINDQINLLLANESLTTLIARVSDGAELTPEDRLRLDLLASSQLRVWQSVYFQYERREIRVAGSSPSWPVVYNARGCGCRLPIDEVAVQELE